jgi:hypothetical protein
MDLTCLIHCFQRVRRSVPDLNVRADFSSRAQTSATGTTCGSGARDPLSVAGAAAAGALGEAAAAGASAGLGLGLLFFFFLLACTCSPVPISRSKAFPTLAMFVR